MSRQVSGMKDAISISKLKESDIPSLKKILAEHVKDDSGVLHDEIVEIISCMKGGTDAYGRKREYVVARDATGKVLGCMGYTEPEPDLLRLYNVISNATLEIVNAFVAVRRKGIGRKLFDAVCRIAKQRGKSAVLLNSGPRYKESWGFYGRVCDESSGFLKNKYGTSEHAKTWMKKL